MSHDLPGDWYEEHDGQRLVLNSEKVAAGIAAAIATERETCARIAENYYKVKAPPEHESGRAVGEMVGKQIAEGIRSAGQSSP